MEVIEAEFVGDIADEDGIDDKVVRVKPVLDSTCTLEEALLDEPRQSANICK